MDTLLLLFIIAALVAVIAFLLWQGKKQEDSASSLMLQNQIVELNRTLDAKLGESSKAIREQFGESAKIIREITQELVKVGEGQKQVMGVTDQLKNLGYLEKPKAEGGSRRILPGNRVKERPASGSLPDAVCV
ncbi:MAG: hypothetical protein A3D64_01990 [Candidatus Wildermuthbacteria bacterium RIFCSPHIGHO2_02_FULL_49_9]|uniref:DNA recombination protein RmuC n=1 Tax=Candidatus Wildermuthbacteria bacterium RIFCSPHIGHO2_02_FULL_49_9 TaxID=1802456 RepID=A0A1G2RGW8_9BACT|nr:MAG: hypothetical protein A3D64_01990 [Candidatus Wildermuthbacteria bacterium RIFCSPHIGHO2_02_FULL_49_9]